MEDLEEDESDIEDTAEWGGSYWGAPGSAGALQGAGARGGDSDSEDGAEDDEGEKMPRRRRYRPCQLCCCSCRLALLLTVRHFMFSLDFLGHEWHAVGVLSCHGKL